MDTAYRQLSRFPSLRISRNSSNVSTRQASFVEDHDPRYISLKDIILHSPTPTCYTTNLLEGTDVNSSNISIRNELVKRAASAYLQSAAILVRRNESFWGNIRIRAQNYLYERNPLGGCFRHVYMFLARTVGILWNRLVHIPST